MKRMLTIGLMIVLSGLWLACTQAQNFDLRQRIVHADEVMEMSCAAELSGLDSNTAPNVRVIGTAVGTLHFYGFQTSVQRLGRIHLSGGTIQQIAAVPSGPTIDRTAGYFLAVVVGSRLYLLEYLRNGTITPRGVVRSVAASSVSMEWLDTTTFSTLRLVVGTRDGRILVYQIGIPASADSFDAPVNLGNPQQVIVLPSNSPVKRAALVGDNLLVVAIGQTIYRYTLQSGQFVQTGKDMRLFAPVAEMVASGNYIVAASEDGYVYAWTTSNGAFAGMLKDRYNGNLEANCLCLLPNNQVAVGYRSVRIYNLPNFEQAGEVGVPLVGRSELGNGQAYSSFRPSAAGRVFGSSILPLYSSGVNLPVAADPQGGLPRVAFVTPNPYHRRYNPPASRPPIYAVAPVSYSQITNGIAYGYADGQVRVYNLAAAGTTPALTLNLGRPVFALAFANFNNAPWLLISAGALGEVFAWNLSTNTSIPVIPPSGAPRILYGVKVQSVGTSLVFWTAASDGNLEQWSWTGTGNAALIRGVPAMNAPLWSLDINSSGHVAVAGAEGVRYLVGTNLLSYANHWRAFSVAFRPNRPNEFAVSAFERIDNSLTRTPRLYLYTFDNAGNISPLFTLERGYRSSYPYEWVDYSPALLAWVNQDLVAAASIYGGKVRLYNCSSRSLHYSDLPADDRGTWDNSTVDAYEPVRDGALAFASLVNGSLLTVGSASGEGVVWGRSIINWTSFYLGYPLSIDFLRTGQRVYPGRIFDPNNNFHIPISPFYDETVVLPHSTGDLIVYKLVGIIGISRTWFADRLQFTNNFPSRLERVIDRVVAGVDLWGNPLQDTSHTSLAVARLEGSDPSNTWNGFCRIVNLQNLNSPLIITSPNLSVNWPSGGNRLYLALAPNGSRFAISDYRSNQVQVWTHSSGNWTSATFNLPVAAGSGYNRALRFVTDNQILVAYPDGSPITWRLALYNWSGSAWVQVGAPVDTQQTFYDLVDSRYYGVYFANQGRLIDVVVVNNVPRVVFTGGDGLAFYRITNNALQLVGRATLSSSGFMEGVRYGWARFNRQNPNRVGIASAFGNTATALELDVSNLSW